MCLFVREIEHAAIRISNLALASNLAAVAELVSGETGIFTRFPNESHNGDNHLNCEEEDRKRHAL